ERRDDERGSRYSARVGLRPIAIAGVATNLRVMSAGMIAIGVALGVAIGAMFDNIAMGIGVGIAIGIAGGLAVHDLRRRK
ncbi:MAG TPA: hypothetical protein VG742_22490, partial [Dongiaceae bacterium]|nr:hypothetical protein [Dongiaceae bacterium]